jgi:hypothetical protein
LKKYHWKKCTFSQLATTKRKRYGNYSTQRDAKTPGRGVLVQ